MNANSHLGGSSIKPLAAIALSVGILGALCTWLFLTVGSIVVWAAFVAWACFFQAGGDLPALRSSITSNIFGCVVGWLGAVIILAIPLGATLSPPVWAGVVVFLTVVIYISASQIQLFASVPGTTFGYACTFAYLLQTPKALDLSQLLQVSAGNVLLIVPPSMVIGSLFGFASAKLAAFLTSNTETAAG